MNQPRQPGRPAQRRRPRQERARNTARALREAFVQLLDEQEYAAITVRQITWLAGTALGSFYDYFASKDDLARVCLHLRSKMLLKALREAVATARGKSLQILAVNTVQAMIRAHHAGPRQWRQHYLLERQLSSREAYDQMYRRFVSAWADGIATSADWPPGRPAEGAATVAQAILYGLFSHSYLAAPDEGPDLEQLQFLATAAVTAVLQRSARPVTAARPGH